MAEEVKKDVAAAAEEPKKKGLPLIPIIAVASVLLLEAVVIVGLFMFSGGPSEVKAEPGLADEIAAGEAPAEILVLAGKFQNTKSGRSFMYDTEIYVKTKQKHLELLEERKEQLQATITKEIATIYRRAEPSHLREQELATLTRQVTSALEEVFGEDENDEPYVQEVLITKCMEFASDY
jgi:flagellar basal body-associated protein FliL